MFTRLVLVRLVRSGDITRSGDGAIGVTASGRARGARVARNHALWEQYLVSYAEVAPSHVDWSVDQVEHVLSEALVEELERALVKRGIALPAAFDSGSGGRDG